jgi:hypothetical protein
MQPLRLILVFIEQTAKASSCHAFLAANATGSETATKYPKPGSCSWRCAKVPAGGMGRSFNRV